MPSKQTQKTDRVQKHSILLFKKYWERILPKEEKKKNPKKKDQ